MADLKARQVDDDVADARRRAFLRRAAAIRTAIGGASGRVLPDSTRVIRAERDRRG